MLSEVTCKFVGFATVVQDNRDCSAVVERERERKKPTQLLDEMTQKQENKTESWIAKDMFKEEREKEGGKERGRLGREGLGGREKDGKTERSRKREKNNM